MHRLFAIIVDAVTTVYGQVFLHLHSSLLAVRIDGKVVNQDFLRPQFVDIKRNKLYVLVQSAINMSGLECRERTLILQIDMTPDAVLVVEHPLR